MRKRIGVTAAFVDGAFIPGDVEIDGDVIASVGVQPAGSAGLALPGFVDLQVNGFAGIDFLSTDIVGVEHARKALTRFGVTSFQPTLVSSPLPTYHAALRDLSAARAVGARMLGVHLEGPFLAPEFKGAHDERWIRDPDLAVAERLIAAGPVTYMTVAPERPGGLELVDWLVARGIVVSIGHTAADAEQAHAAYNRGARTVTHLFNAQRRFTARDPGISGVALSRADVTVQLIADLVHLAPETVLASYRAAHQRFAVVTDAIAAAAHGPGDYALGDRTIHVDDVVARLDDGTLAGSILTMDRALRNLVAVGVPLVDAVRATSVVPARLVGRPDLGTLRPGTPADLVVVDGEQRVLRTLVAGHEWCAG